ncbi:carbohydrate-binding module family 13 protein [Stipitochalara longipes BDJ]|nr:carbohydrate-binding module family 13 protein [Stipitochalara longipes BDJ]
MHFSTLTALTALSNTIAFALPAENEADVYIAYSGPGNYYLQNAATGTVLDLLNGNPGPNTPINGYTLNPGPHQIWQVSTTGPNNEVTIINTATGAIASCPHAVNAPNGWFQMVGGEVPIDSYARFNMITNADNSLQFKNEATGNCMDMAQSSPANGANVLCYPCHPGVGSNQNWVLLGA